MGIGTAVRLTKAQRDMLERAEARDVLASFDNRTAKTLRDAGFLEFGCSHGAFKAWWTTTEAGREALKLKGTDT
jgi:hypothetical protein